MELKKMSMDIINVCAQVKLTKYFKSCESVFYSTIKINRKHSYLILLKVKFVIIGITHCEM